MERKTQNAKRKTTIGKAKLFLALLPLIVGCAAIQETARGIAGTSTKVLEEGRKEALVKKFNYDYNTCYSKVLENLTEKGSCIYAQSAKQHMLALYVSPEDTTPVGVFFKEIDANNTQMEVSSPSKFAKEFIAKRAFSTFDKSQNAEAETNAKKESGNK